MQNGNDSLDRNINLANVAMNTAWLFMQRLIQTVPTTHHLSFMEMDHKPNEPCEMATLTKYITDKLV